MTRDVPQQDAPTIDTTTDAVSEEIEVLAQRDDGVEGGAEAAGESEFIADEVSVPADSGAVDAEPGDNPAEPVTHVTPSELADDAIALVRRWLVEASASPIDVAGQRLAGVLSDEHGLDFTVGFVDGVARPEDLVVAGRGLETVAKEVPAFLPWYLRGAVKAGGVVSQGLPGLVVPISRRVLRNMVGHLIIDATDRKLGPAISKLRTKGDRLNINLLGEAVLGNKEANRRLDGLKKLIARNDVDYVSVKVSAVAPHPRMWAFDATVKKVSESLVPLYRIAAPARKFINLDMEEYRDLDLTMAVFMNILDREEFLDYEGGIVLQSYLPDALGALRTLTEWSRARRARGGAPIKVRVVKGANLAMERVDAAIHGWPLATLPTKQSTDANYKRVLDYALTAQNTDAVRIGVAGHNLFDIALALLLARARGVEDAIDFEMLLGMATAQADAVRRDVGELVLYTPVVHPAEFDVAISYLVRRLEENASSENFMSGVFDLSTNPRIFDREKERFLASLAELVIDDEPQPNRVQDRTSITAIDRAGAAFANTPDTDPSIAVNREWAARILSRVADSSIGNDTLAEARVEDPEVLEGIIEGVLAGAKGWGAKTGAERAAVLHRAGIALEANRDRLLEVMASETGKTIDQGDPEVSEAVDFAHYYAEQAIALDAVDGARFVPATLSVVTPPWNFPVAIPAGSVLAALAAGSGVIMKPAPQARRSAAVLSEALWEAGIPRDVFSLVDLDEGELGKSLISDARVDRVILTGAWETAALFKSWREDLPILAETSGKNAMIITPSADLDLAVADVVASAFGHAGQKCSAASLVILVGSVAKSERFRRQLVDATSSLRVGLADDASTEMGPLIEPASGKLLGALSTLGAGESWLVEPTKRSSDGTLWSPGIREGVLPGSEFHLTEYFGPVLGIMHAPTLEKAIELQNAVAYGLTAGLHSLDRNEVEQWLATVQAGNLYVNRGTTGAIVQRQPFGGWKRSSVGAGAKAGGPNYLPLLGSWITEPGEPSSELSVHEFDERVSAVLDATTTALEWSDFDIVRRSAISDDAAWKTHFAIKDVSALGVERNVFRYRPVPVTIRLADGGSLAELVRVIAAGTLARSEMTISSSHKLPRDLRALMKVRRVGVTIETDAKWLARLGADHAGIGRIRVIGAAVDDSARDISGETAAPEGMSIQAIAAAVAGDPDVAIYASDVTRAGRIELLPFVHEQAISITNHRFGNPTTLTEGLL